MMNKNVYFFGDNKTEGNKEMKELLGGKGANLAEMAKLNIPVPPGFTISTESCANYYLNNQELPEELLQEINYALASLEESMNAKLNDENNPLLLSVRSGAAKSMPGMMDTVLNLGLNDEVVAGLAKKTGNERFAYDSYRRFIQMFGDVVMNVEHEHFESALHSIKKQKGVVLDTELSADDLKELVTKYKEIIKQDTGMLFPIDGKEQLLMSIKAVFDSWNNNRAITYRKLNDIRGLKGTAVNIQSMVFGNMGDSSGTGVCFTRDPSTGENKFYGEYLMNAQGEDVVAGIRTPQPISQLEKSNKEVYDELVKIYKKLENHYKDMQDIEFTIQEGKLFILQTRNGKRTAHAAIRIAVEMVSEGLISKEEALLRIDPEQLNQLLHKQLSDDAKKTQELARGLPASPGAAVGRIAFTANRAVEMKQEGNTVILVRNETSPEDLIGMDAATGILTARGGMTSHAAVVARGMGKCCVSGCSDAKISEKEKTLEINNKRFNEGDYITLEGSQGKVYEGELETVEPELSGDFETIMNWASEIKVLGVRTNADTPKDASVAIKFGAEGIGLCRTEHMFFDEERIKAVREMILSSDVEGRRKALEKILPYQKDDFVGLFETMNGMPVTIRLLDPPLHEFLPREEKEIQEIAKELGVTSDLINKKIEDLHEVNPMLGHRGCRLGITYPEITLMQCKAIFDAAKEVSNKGINVKPEIMIPLVGNVKEFLNQKELVQSVAKSYDIDYLVGTMIEVPRAAITADEIAEVADFFSFGTNDLTQMTLGFSRDDVGKFISEYLDKGILENDPFQSLDQTGVGHLVKHAVKRGKMANEKIKLGICGEHGGDPSSIEFCHDIGLNYVSCSPYRVPIAKLAAAIAALK